MKNQYLCPICAKASVGLEGQIPTYVNEKIILSAFSFCQECNFAFNSNPPDKKLLEEYYTSNSQLRRNLMTSEEASHLTDQLDFLVKNNSKTLPVKVLEIGADNGNFLGLIKIKFPQSELFFDELNVEAKNNLSQKGFLDVKHSAEKKFDVIVMRHVLEHISDPVDYLKNLRDKVAENGILFIEVPDCSSINVQESDDFIFEHINYFSLESPTKIAKSCGYLIESTETRRTLGFSTTPNYVLRLILRRCDSEKYNGESDWQSRLNKTTRLYSSIREILNSLNGKRVALYGAGTVTQNLLAGSSDFQIQHIYDIDPKKIGKSLLGYKVELAQDMSSQDFDFILILVVGYETEVLFFLETKHVSKEKIISYSEIINKL